MASFQTACRLSTRLASRQLRQEPISRGLRTSAACLAAQNFTMPALSPTMTEGNISKWKVKEGDTFAAGDILLEIETDKASMDVEAQDDGIMAKIMQGDGSKGIKVGTRIGVLAEEGDDIASLDIPPEENAAPPSPKEEAQSLDPETTSESAAEAPPSSKPSTPTDSPPKKTGKPRKQTYPLLPSVEHLLHEHGLDASAVDKMTPSGPNNRLLKGDVLAYIGIISNSYPDELSSKIAKLSHLDLSNIKIAPPAAAPKSTKEAAPSPLPVVEDLEVAVPVSMKAAIEVQKRIHTTLGIFMPLSTFIARATEVANDDLPRSKSHKVSADELFNEILGLDVIAASGAKGSFEPLISALPPVPTQARLPRSSPKKVDIIDILSGRTGQTATNQTARRAPGLSSNMNVFSLTVQKGDEKRAQVFLDRVKNILEDAPGRLIL